MAQQGVSTIFLGAGADVFSSVDWLMILGEESNAVECFYIDLVQSVQLGQRITSALIKSSKPNHPQAMAGEYAVLWGQVTYNDVQRR